jgi:integrase
VATLSPADVCLETRTWTIPAEVAKNTDAHVVHLSEFAVCIWGALERIAGPVWVFEGRTEGAHLSEKEVTRRLVDRQTRGSAIGRRKNTKDLDLPGGHWTQHDLRRTAATIMGELGIAPEVIDRCLNHREAKKVTRTYQRQKMMPQRKAAFEALGAHLIETVGHPRAWQITSAA